MTTLKNDSIYYNFELRNDATKLGLNQFPIIQARQDINFSEALLQNPNEFYCSITRFSVSGKALPLMVIPILAGISQTNPNLTPWTVSLVYQNNVFTAPIIYIPTNDLTVPKPPSQNNGVQDVGLYYYIYFYSDLAYFISNALTTAYNALKTAFPLAPVGQAPYILFEEDKAIYKLVCDRLMSPFITPAPNTVDLYFNPALALVMANIPNQYFTNPPLGNLNLSNIIAIYNETNNDNEYFVNGVATTPRTLFFNQEFNNVAFINAVKSIVFISNTLGTNKEFISSRTASEELNGLSILTDFEADFSVGGSVQNYITFATTGTGNYRLVDIKNTMPLNKLDLSIYWTDQLGNLYPVFLYPNTYITVKFVFTRKTLYRKD
jgi:hypothetical protein